MTKINFLICLFYIQVISRLVTVSKFRLGQLVTEEQLLKLIHMCIDSQLPWAPHALACLLQDILDLVRPPPFTTEMETESSNSASTSWGNTGCMIYNYLYKYNIVNVPDLLSDVESLCESFGLEEITEPPAAKQGKNNNNNNNNNGNQLPSVYESEDSELEDFLDDILERGRSLLKKTSKGIHSCNGSYAMDSRLEMGVETSAEIILRKLVMLSSHSLLQNVNSGWGCVENEIALQPWPTSLILPWQMQPQCNASYRTMLMNCFDSLFENIQNQPNGGNLEQILQLWLMLNCSNAEEKFDPSAIPFIGLSPEAVNSLVSAIAWSPGLSLRTWCTALQTLTLVCNLTHGPPSTTTQWTDMYGLYRMTSCLVTHNDFVQMLIRLLSGTGLLFSDKGLVSKVLIIYTF